MVVGVERILGDEHPRRGAVDTLLYEHGGPDLEVVDARRLPRFIRLVVPQRSPHGLDRFAQCPFAFHIGHRGVEPRAAEVGQVLRVGGAPDEEPFISEHGLRLGPERLLEGRVQPPGLDPRPHRREPLPPVGRIRLEARLRQERPDLRKEPVGLVEALAMREWHAEALRHDGIPHRPRVQRMLDLAEIRGLRPEPDVVPPAHVLQIRERQPIEVIHWGSEVLGSRALAAEGFHLLRGRCPQIEIPGPGLEDDHLAIQRLEARGRVSHESVRDAPPFGQQVDVRQRRGKRRRDDSGDRRQGEGRLLEHEDVLGFRREGRIRVRGEAQHPNAPGGVERDVILRRVQVTGVDHLGVAQGLRGLLLAEGVRLERHRREERRPHGRQRLLDEGRACEISFP